MNVMDSFFRLSKELNKGYKSFMRMRGSGAGNFYNTLLETSLSASKQSYTTCLNNTFDSDLLDEVSAYCKNKGYPVFSIQHFNKLYDTYISKRFSKARCFFDMDGVLYKFDNTLPSLDPLYEEGYFKNIPLSKAAAYCLNKMLDRYPDQVYILSHALDSPYASKEKLEALHRDFPKLKDQNIILVPYGKAKTDYVPVRVKQNDVLIDDYNKNLITWNESGGYAVKYVNEINDIRGSWKGRRIEYDDPKLTLELTDIFDNLKDPDTIDLTNPELEYIENKLYQINENIVIK